MSAVIRKVKGALDNLYKSVRFHFISNFKITRDFLYNVGIEQTEEQTYILSMNFVDFVKGNILSEGNECSHDEVYSKQKQKYSTTR